jgi:hypothetical protein
MHVADYDSLTDVLQEFGRLVKRHPMRFVDKVEDQVTVWHS